MWKTRRVLPTGSHKLVMQSPIADRRCSYTKWYWLEIMEKDEPGSASCPLTQHSVFPENSMASAPTRQSNCQSTTTALRWRLKRNVHMDSSWTECVTAMGIGSDGKSHSAKLLCCDTNWIRYGLLQAPNSLLTMCVLLQRSGFIMKLKHPEARTWRNRRGSIGFVSESATWREVGIHRKLQCSPHRSLMRSTSRVVLNSSHEGISVRPTKS